MVFVGSASCGWATKARLGDSIETLKRSLKQQADANGYVFAVVGVARASSPEAGYRYLRHFGTFDAIWVGRDLGSVALLDHRYGEDLAASTPQVLVIARDGGNDPLAQASEQRIAARMVGKGPILSWAEAGGSIRLMPKSR